MQPDFETFFMAAMGTSAAVPYGFQRRVAEDGLPDVLVAPTGAGKTAAVVLPWLWRREHHSDPAIRSATPRRLILALPMRTLVDQVAEEVATWLRNLGAAERVALHVAMGGRLGSQHEWRQSLHRPAVVVGTSDIVVSKLLNRAYGASRATYPIDFALATNGSHVVLDEIQLAPESTATLRQMAAFAGQYGTAEPFGITCMSATLTETALDTVDNPWPGTARVVRLGPGDDTGELARRRAARRRVEHLTAVGDARGLAAAVVAAHQPGTRTLVVLNTVRSAVDVARALDRLAPPAHRVLVHSRFRPVERAEHTARLRATIDEAGPGVIAVATQVIEAGVDIDSATLVTEVPPWPSLCQRAGRCNRYARYSDARLLWTKPEKEMPYDRDDVEATAAELRRLEGATVTSEDLLGSTVPVKDPAISVLRRHDFLALFDTAPDLDGSDVDISPYVRDSNDMDVLIAWLDVDERVGPPAEVPLPAPEWRCPVPISEARRFAGRARLWRYDVHNERWDTVGSNNPLRPGEVLIAAARAGGYQPATGFDASSSVAVHPVQGLDTISPVDAGGFCTEGQSSEPGSVAQPGWLDLDTHLRDTAEQAADLVRVLDPQVDEASATAVVTAARLHDLGKLHPEWQRALRSLAQGGKEAPADGLLAKSPYSGRLGLPSSRAGFRHELLSALLLRELPDDGWMDGGVDRDLVRYLVAAHHGKIRVQARDAGQPTGARLLGLIDGEEIASATVLRRPTPTLRVSLAEFRLGGDESWTRTALGLRERLGPFRLAYLEALVRIADWRASDHNVLPSAEGTG